MAEKPKMKIGIGADTGDFEKGAHKVKQEMKDLNKVSSDAFSSIGSAIGIDTGKLQQFSSAVGGLAQKFMKLGGDGKGAFNAISAAVGGTTAAIAGLGLGAAITGFKALTSEAEAFKNTVAGANMEMQTAAYIATYNQVIHDYNQNIGSWFAGLESNWKKFWGTASSSMTAYFSTGAWKDDFTPWSSDTSRTEEFNRLIANATTAGERAATISKEIYELDLQRINSAREIADLNKTISEQTLQARELQAAGKYEEALKSIANAREAINRKAELQIPIENEVVALMDKANKLASSHPDVLKAANAQYEKAQSIAIQRNNEERSLLRIERAISDASAKDTANRAAAAKSSQELAANMARVAASQEEMKNLQLPNLGGLGLGSITIPLDTKLKPPTNIEEVKVLISEYLGGGITIGISISESDIAKIQDITDKVKSMIQDMAVKIGESIGTLLGDLVTGGDAWSNFASNAIKAFGDMAIAIGKIAIEAGTGALGIKAALSLSEAGAYAAIAAGTALIILGAAVKSGLSNIASGNYSASSGVASGNYSSGSSGFATSEVTVHVTGELRADGDQLVTVINNANRRRGYNT